MEGGLIKEMLLFILKANCWQSALRTLKRIIKWKAQSQQLGSSQLNGMEEGWSEGRWQQVAGRKPMGEDRTQLSLQAKKKGEEGWLLIPVERG